MFGALRAEAPASALELLTASWATEPSTTRAAFVAAMSTGLGADDEDFLEAVLDDSRKDVRAAAAALLRGLPGSRRAARLRRLALAAGIYQRAASPRPPRRRAAATRRRHRRAMALTRADKTGTTPQWLIRQLVGGYTLAQPGRALSGATRATLSA